MKKILAIDDKMDNLVSLSALLKNLMPGSTMIPASSGMDGLEKAKTERPDVILLDVKMPDMDGFETCRRLKTHEDTKHIPVIMITAIKTDSRSRTKGLDLGADAFLSKPIDETELVSQLKVAFRIKKAEDALRRERDSLEQLVAERTRMLRDNEAKYRSMMESITDPLSICASGLTVEYMNPAMIKRLGRDATGEICHKALHALDHPCDWCVFEKIAQGKAVETTITSPRDGRTYRVTNMPVHQRNGTVSKMSIFRDITDYLTAVAEKEKAQAQLRQAQKMEAIGNLAGGIAHDFNNILFPIVGMSELLLEDLPAGSLEHENAQEIFTAGKRGRELVKQILAFSRQSEHKLVPVRIQRVLRDVLKLCRATIPVDIEIQQEIQEHCGLVMSDPTQLHQVAMNLITNAYHALDTNSGKIMVQLKETTIRDNELINLPVKTSPYAKLTVSDTGKGIDPGMLDKIFEPYFTTKEKGKGTGLGLAVVHGIIKAHGGEITVCSDPGKGSTFNVFIPLMEKPAMENAGKKVEILQTGTEKILLVDDEEPIARLEKQILERLGYAVTTYHSSTDAYNAFKSKPDAFDLVISDMTMPNMMGDQLAKKISSIRANIPVIICTGFSERIDKEKAEADGIKGFLMKPVAKSDMARMIRRILDESKRPAR